MRMIGRLMITSLQLTSRVTIAAGPLHLFDNNGSSVIVHLNEDQGATG